MLKYRKWGVFLTLDFNKDWIFYKPGGDGVEIDLPHDAMQTEKRSPSARNGVNSGYFPGGKYVYEKTFSIRSEDLEKSFVLHFEGVYQNSRVLINSAVAGAHRYGYTPFDIDISNYVHEGENIVTVLVDNSLEPNCRWYSGSGIYKPVTLLIRDKCYIKDVSIITKSIDPVVVSISAKSTTECKHYIEIYEENKLIYSGDIGDVTISDARLWSAESPFLYTAKVKTDTDEKKLEFGIRDLKWSAKDGLTVNGESVLLRGGCIHHDHGVLGACEYKDAEERRIKILKESGFNAVRIAHHPASQITLDACDKIGMYVMNETFDGWYTPKTYHDYSRWFYDDWKNDIEAMVRSAKNHPSVIMYSIGNEVTETAERKGTAICREMTDFVHSLDDTRPVTAGVNVLLNVYTNLGMGVYRDKGNYKPDPLPEGKKYKEKKTGSAFFNALTQKLGKLMFFMSSGRPGDMASKGAADGLDILGLNYASSRYDYDAKKYPDRLMVGAETMAQDLPYNWERVKKYPQLIGDFVWSAWDYLGETCMGWTYHSYKGLPLLANQGMIDITGKPLASMGFMQVVWGLRDKPYIAVRPLNHVGEKPSKGSWQFTDAIDSWNWVGYEGTIATVEVYADGHSVRLSLNGNEICKKRIKNFKAIFKLPYNAGNLKAEVIDKSGNVISSHSLFSGDGELKLSAAPEKAKLSVGKICYIPIEFVDGKGLLRPDIERRVDISVEGGKLLGFGSALYKTDDSFNNGHYNSYRGRCLAVVQATDEGLIDIKIKSAGVDPANITLEVK
jgi:hypothetical protein